MKLSGRFLRILASVSVFVALCGGCATSRGEPRALETALVYENFTEAPLRDALIAIEKAGSRGIAVDMSVDLDQLISARFEGVSPSGAVDAIARLAGYEWIYDPDLPETMEAYTDSLSGQYWEYPMYLIAKNVEQPVFAEPAAQPEEIEEPVEAEAEEAAPAEPEEAIAPEPEAPEAPAIIVWPPKEGTEPAAKQVPAARIEPELPAEKPRERVTASKSAAPEEVVVELPNLIRAGAEAPRSQPTVSNVFVNTDIREAVSDISAQTGVNVVADASVEGWVTLSFEETPIEEALSMICLAGGFTWKRIGDYYLVGSATPDSVNYSLLSETRAIRTNLPGLQVKNRLSEFFAPYVRTATDADHVLIVTGPPEVVESVMSSIHEIDEPQKQIVIDALITDVTATKDSNIGTDWMSTVLSVSGEGTMDFAYGVKPIYTSTIMGMVLAEFNALAQSGDLTVRAHPTIMTLEGETAEIKIVEERYFSILTGSVTYPTSDIEVISSGVTLNVRAVVTRTGEILLTIMPDVSDVTGESGGRENLPLINRRIVESTVRVKNGETVVIGGLYRHLSREVVRKIPLLGSIPIINFAFRSKSLQESDTDLIVFITPRVVSD